MSNFHKHPKSRVEWFRMDVPVRLRPLVGKTSWKQSLHTTDKALAAIKRAQLTADHKAEILRLDGQLAGQEMHEARDLVDRAFEVWAARTGSMDHVVRALLTLTTLSARQSWSGEHERRAAWDFGTVFYTTPDDDDDDEGSPLPPYPGFDRETDREAFITRQKLIEGRGVADGIVLQEIAQRLLDSKAWDHVYGELFLFLDAVGVDLKLHTAKYDAAAERLLQRLAAHQFGDWKPRVREALAPLVIPNGAQIPHADHVERPTFAAGDASRQPLRGHPIASVFAGWCEKTKARQKTKDEFGRGVSLFVRHFGDVAVETITTRMIVDWKNLLQKLPARAPKEIAVLPPSDQAVKAAELGLPLIGGQTANKYLQALRSTFKFAAYELLIIDKKNLPSDGVSIVIDDDERVEVTEFSDEQLQMIFSHPVMMDAANGTDEIYWFLLLAPFTGCRLEETAQLRPSNIHSERGISFIGIERDPVARRKQIAIEGGHQKKLKTKTTKRNIPIHSVLRAAGFLEYAALMQARQADWLFDGLTEYKKYGLRGKSMSNKLMRLLRRLGITDRETVYHSFRHTLKRVLRNDERTKEEISDLLTGHSFTESVGRRYARGAGLRTLADAIERVNYEVVDWAPVIATGRARVERLRREMGDEL